jgi:hypothetical protein
MRRYRRVSPRSVLMVSQVAGSLTLLVILGLLAFGIQTTLGVQSGFDPRNLYLVSLDPVRDGYSGEQATAFFQKLLDRVKTLPSVSAASLTETVPVSMPGEGVTFSTPGARRAIHAWWRTRSSTWSAEITSIRQGFRFCWGGRSGEKKRPTRRQR